MFSVRKEWKELTQFCRNLPLNRFIAVNFVLECKLRKEDFEGLEQDVVPFTCTNLVVEWEYEREGLTLDSLKREKIKGSFLWLMDSGDLEKISINKIVMTNRHKRYVRALYRSASGSWSRWIRYSDWLKEAQKDDALFIRGRPTTSIPGTMTNGVFHLQGLIQIDLKKRPRRFRLTYLGKRYVEEEIPEVVDEVLRKRIEVREKIYKKYVSREESKEHKRQKQYLIQNAEEIFGRGTRLFKEEYLFSTNDRADLLFYQPSGHYIAVEVEVEVGEEELAGLLQAIKYKYMFAVEEDLIFDQVNGC